MGAYTNIVRGIVQRNQILKLKIKKAGIKSTPFQYVHQSIFMTFLSIGFIMLLVYLFLKNNFIYLFLGMLGSLFLTPIIFKFWFSYIDVQIEKYKRTVEGDLLFICEYLLVSLESGLPLGNAIKRFSRLNRPGAKFFKRIYTDFQTGKSLEAALIEASKYSPSESLRVLLKRLQDSLNIGVDLKTVLENFILESSDKKIIEIKGYSKKLNPIIMMYLLLGIVMPSLGITFFILGAAMLEITPVFLRLILIMIFLLMFGFQYMSYSAFKFSKSAF